MITISEMRRDSLKSTKSVLGSINSAILDSLAHGKRADMKLPFSFLKKKSDSQPSVRPHPHEVQSWAEDFRNLIASKYGRSLFEAFLQREFSEENLYFWLAVEDYRNTNSTTKLRGKAIKIHLDFVAIQSPKEINLDSTMRAQILSNIDNPDKTIFDCAQKRIQALMESDSYLRFLNCDLYKELLNREST